MIQQPKNFDELYELFLAICPHGQMGEDNEGQLVFYTGLQEDSDGTLLLFQDEEER